MGNPQVTARVSVEFAERMDALVEILNEKEENKARPLNRNELARRALAVGVDVMESQNPGNARPAAKKSAKKGARK